MTCLTCIREMCILETEAGVYGIFWCSRCGTLRFGHGSQKLSDPATPAFVNSHAKLLAACKAAHEFFEMFAICPIPNAEHAMELTALAKRAKQATRAAIAEAEPDTSHVKQ